MVNNIMGFNLMGMLLITLTIYFISQDKAFEKRIRVLFQIASALCLYLTLLSNHLTISNMSVYWFTKDFVRMNELLFRPVILAILIYVSLKIKRTKNDSIFSVVILGLTLIVLLTEKKDGPLNVVNNLLCLSTSAVYFYNVLQIYKKDGLTRLLLRNNLNFDMEDLQNRRYHIVLIDVDNFKLINDKYGHDKGDEVLVTIVNTVKKHLTKGCKLYRYGGDEFVVISKKDNPDKLTEVFENINSELAKEELRISYGIVTHEAKTNGNAALTEADKRMYENKKLLKSEDIWDDMTGLYNYRGFIDELDAFRKVVYREGNTICLISVDIDRLSNINMAYGYTEGNIAIKALARIIKSCLKGRDFIGHLGSDEFEVAIECTGEEDVRIAEFISDIQDGIGGAYEFANKDYSIKVNIGRYFIPVSITKDSEELVNDVLYVKQSEKEDRRKTDIAEDEQDNNATDEAIVKNILDNNKFKYAFQPIVSAKGGEIVAYEALMRSDTETMISPLKILKYADRNKRLYDVEKLTFFNVLKQIKETQCIPEGRRIFINSIPGYMLSDGDFDNLKRLYSELFDRMVIEITEQREVDDDALAALNARRDICGFNLAIDDYGSGCSNTNSLLRYMPQVVKLDRLLITGIDRNAKKQFFVNSIISFARENDMLILAEGVETESELKTVIRLGVDMIQGFFTAKPAFEMIDEIPKDIKKIIVDENMRVSGNQRMVYTASSSCELSVVHLAMEDYSKINISGEYVSLIGNPEYTADMVLKIKDGVTCNLTLTNVFLNSVDDEPCIDIGEGANLILSLEGNSRFNAKGIHVPEGSSLTVKGSGNLEIFAKGHECYGIGSDSESGFGVMHFKNSGDITINNDGEHCIGIGGGIASEKSKLEIFSGKYYLNVAGVLAVGIGFFKGNVPITIRDCNVNSDFRVNTGVVIGIIDGELDLGISGFDINIEGSGTEVCGIGSFNETSGNISMLSGTYRIKLNGQKLYLLGCKSGNVNIDVRHVRSIMCGEGDNVLGFGSMDKLSHLHAPESGLDLVINASSPLGFGVDNEDIGFRGHLVKAVINGVTLEFE